ncbi:hypothetical protein EV127DRAFT_403990 [Xylaria flabelliformis]|nr:hypothetical protein EV127DRAFT_403990 [Xylaria flabelliformis]
MRRKCGGMIAMLKLGWAGLRLSNADYSWPVKARSQLVRPSRPTSAHEGVTAVSGLETGEERTAHSRRDSSGVEGLWGTEAKLYMPRVCRRAPVAKDEAKQVACVR